MRGIKIFSYQLLIAFVLFCQNVSAGSIELYASRNSGTSINSLTLIGKKFVSGNSLLNYVAAEVFIELVFAQNESWDIKTIIPDGPGDDSVIRLLTNPYQYMSVAWKLTGSNDTPLLNATIPSSEFPIPSDTELTYHWFWPTGRALMSSNDGSYVGRQRLIIAVHIPAGTTPDPFPPSGTYSNIITFDLTVQ